MKALIVGGTSGLGLELAKRLQLFHDSTIITGRKDPQIEGLTFVNLPLGSEVDLPASLDRLMHHSPFDAIIYNPGFYQEGRISDLTDQEITDMVNVGFLGVTLLMQRVLQKQDGLPLFVAITSTSQWTPRELEPVYTGVKAALGMFANSLSLDRRIRQTLVVGPSGMQTKFWEGTGKDVQGMLDPAWVAEQILDLLKDDFRYKYARILRGPARVEIVEMR